MKKSQLPILVGNEITVKTYADDIKRFLSEASASWRRIAEVFESAQDQFGRQSKEMSSLALETNFSQAKVDKLVQIAKSKVLKENPHLFDSVQTWTVLYQVTLLNEEQFLKLKSELLSGKSLTTSLITSIRNPKTNEQENPYREIASIKIDINAIRNSDFTCADLEKLDEILQTIVDTVPFAKIEKTTIVENNYNQADKEVYKEYEKQIRRAFSKEQAKYLNRIKASYGPDYFRKRRSEIKEAVVHMFDDRQYQDAFDCIESDQYNEGRFWMDAMQAVSDRREKKFGCRVGNPFLFANADIRVAA